MQGRLLRFAGPVVAVLVVGFGQGSAHAEGAEAAIADTPGALSALSPQLPTYVSDNFCGGIFDPVGVLNPSVGVKCANHLDDTGTHAESSTTNSGGALNAASAQAPSFTPLNTCAVTILPGVLDPALAGECENTTTSGHGSATAEHASANNPGVATLGTVQLPNAVPANGCADSILPLALDPNAGHLCANH
ncbi:chaplin family protein [Streptomyces lavendulocolor]|uniref:chaplin family protein n=1 Tax=Streptomyces lavendulocolor TaxID=67316 RepID=UPI003C2D011C